MTDKEFVRKLINAFKVLRLSGLSKDIKNDIKAIEQKLQKNKKIYLLIF